jgi:hypothetical protein
MHVIDMMSMFNVHQFLLCISRFYGILTTLSDYVGMNDMMINEQRTGKDFERSGRVLIYGTVPEFACRLRKTGLRADS